METKVTIMAPIFQKALREVFNQMGSLQSAPGYDLHGEYPGCSYGHPQIVHSILFTGPPSLSNREQATYQAAQRPTR